MIKRKTSLISGRSQVYSLRTTFYVVQGSNQMFPARNAIPKIKALINLFVSFILSLSYCNHHLSACDAFHLELRAFILRSKNEA